MEVLYDLLLSGTSSVVDPTLSVQIALLSLFRNWKEEAIDPQTIHRGRTPSQPPEIRPWCLLYRRKQVQESDAQTMHSPRSLPFDVPQPQSSPRGHRCPAS